MDIPSILQRLAEGNDLSVDQTSDLILSIMSGELDQAQTAAIFMGLRCKGETADEIVGAARAMREKAVRISSRHTVIADTCGTGGTGLSTLNISTAAALVAAGAGVAVAKHGNRTHTRTSGSADVLAALGVNLDASPEIEARCLAGANVCFCFAVRHHPAMKYAAPVRKALGVRTIFNVLGPLTNPAGARRQLMGVFDARWVETIARALSAMGAEHAMVVHAEDGLDEISTTAPTVIAEAVGGRVTTRTVQPEDFGLPRAKLGDFAVDSPEDSARRIRDVLAGKKGPDRDIVVLNAAAALAVAGQAGDIAAAIPLAERSIDSGAAAAALEKLIELSGG